jgi:PAS domain S-box-containing protein
MQLKNRAAIWFVLATLIISVLVIGLSILAVLAVSKTYTRPLYTVIERLEHIAKGELEQLPDMSTRETGVDELAILTRVVNKMARDLSKVTVSKNYLDSILGAMLETLIVTTADKVIVKVNPATTALLGYTEEELIGQPMNMIFAEEAPGAGVEWRSAAKEGLIRNCETTYVTKEGKHIPVNFSASFEVDEQGDLRYVVCTAHDITERKRMEGVLLGYIEAIKKSNKELDDFSYIISHDLKEPLRSIDAFSRFLEQEAGGSLTGEAQGYLQRIRSNAGRMKALIEDLLELSRLSKRPNQLQQVSVAKVFDEVKGRFDYLLQERKVQLIVPEDLPVITCEPVRLGEVFANLISNAIKYNDKPQPRIEIGSRLNDGYYEFSVRDNGPGIESQYFEKIFEIFQRLGRKEEQEGTGVGLTIVKKIVELHHGRVWVESTVGQGATFYFTIPADEQVLFGDL